VFSGQRLAFGVWRLALGSVRRWRRAAHGMRCVQHSLVDLQDFLLGLWHRRAIEAASMPAAVGLEGRRAW